jgi:hypothetical protein
MKLNLCFGGTSQKVTGMIQQTRETGFLICLMLFFTGICSAAGELAVEFDKKGLSSIKLRNQEFLGFVGKEPKGEPIASVWFEDENKKQHYEPVLSLDWTDPDTAVRKYSWGTCTVKYKPGAERLDVTVEFQNQSDKTITQAQCDLFYVRFPGDTTPLKWDNTDPPKNDDRSAPTVLVADYGAGKIITVTPDTPTATRTRWGPKLSAGYQLSLLSPTKMAPGATARMSVSCRFCSEQAQPEQVAADAYKIFREQHPSLLRWTDRRPIGALMLATVNKKWPRNPRGWLNAPYLNVFTPFGHAEFRNLVMQKVGSSISNMRRIDAQGVIVWDIEGAQYPQGEATYVGDPRILRQVAPEMDSIADELFGKFRQAGFRVGVCLRADEIHFRPNGSFYQKMFASADELFRSLDERISYARSRWGCTLFYIDSYGGTPAYNPIVLKQLLQKHPDVLLIPEFEQTLTYAFAAPYKELRPMGKNPGTASTPKRALTTYADAFTVINTADGDLIGRRPELVGAVRRGDVLLFRAWWGDEGFQRVRSIYKEGTKR